MPTAYKTFEQDYTAYKGKSRKKLVPLNFIHEFRDHFFVTELLKNSNEPVETSGDSDQ